MTFDINHWMQDLILRLQAHFGPRLLAVGLQGSFARGEARETSDIDAVIVLDVLTPADLDAYKNILSALPHAAHPACGFIGGKEELKNWPKAELFQFTHDTKTLYGSFDGILPVPTRADALDAAKNGAGMLYHALGHTWLHGELSAEFLTQLYKASFFTLTAAHFVRTGRYVHGKQKLLAELSDSNEREILQTALTGEINNPREAAEKLFTWSQNILLLK